MVSLLIIEAFLNKVYDYGCCSRFREDLSGEVGQNCISGKLKNVLLTNHFGLLL